MNKNNEAKRWVSQLIVQPGRVLRAKQHHSIISLRPVGGDVLYLVRTQSAAKGPKEWFGEAPRVHGKLLKPIAGQSGGPTLLELTSTESIPLGIAWERARDSETPPGCLVDGGFHSIDVLHCPIEPE